MGIVISFAPLSRVSIVPKPFSVFISRRRRPMTRIFLPDLSAFFAAVRIRPIEESKSVFRVDEDHPLSMAAGSLFDRFIFESLPRAFPALSA